MKRLLLCFLLLAVWSLQVGAIRTKGSTFKAGTWTSTNVFQLSKDSVVYYVTKAATALGDAGRGECGVYRSPNASGDITIPAEVWDDDGCVYDVVSVLTSAFYDNTGLKSLSFAEDSKVTTIQNYAFKSGSCPIETLNLPASLTSLETAEGVGLSLGELSSLKAVNVASGNTVYSSVDGVLYNKEQTKLLFHPKGNGNTEYTAPSTVTEIAMWAFTNDEKLTTVNLPNVTTFASQSFRNCIHLENVTLSNGITSFDDGVFYQCTGLQNVYIKASGSDSEETYATLTNPAGKYMRSIDGVLFLSDEASSDQSKYTTLYFMPSGRTGDYTVPNSVTTIATQAFNASKLTKVTIPTNVTSIESLAFDQAYIQQIVFDSPAELTPKLTIGDQAFNNCVYLKGGDDTDGTFNLPARVETLGDVNPFSGCVNITAYALNDAYTGGKYAVVEGVLFNNDKTTLISFPGGKQDDYTIPSTVTTVGANSFYNTTSAGTITIPTSVTTISDYAFTAAAFTDYVFEDGSNPLTINKHAFGNCQATEFTLPLRTTTVGENAFTFTYSAMIAANRAYRAGAQNKNNATTTGSYVSAIKILTVPTDIALTSMGQGCFSGMQSLTTLTIGDNVMSGKDQPQEMCANNTKLETVTIGNNSFISIGQSAFEGCTALKTVTVADPGTIATINGNAFKNCSSLTSYNLTSAVTSIGTSAFQGCTSLTSINFDDATGLTNIYEAAFAESGLSGELTLPANLKIIGNNAFYYCKDLTQVNIGASVNTITGNPFAYCTSLKKIEVDENNTRYSSLDGMLTTKDEKTLRVFPSGLAGSEYTMIPKFEAIGDYAFYTCNNLDNITIPENVTKLGKNAFANCTLLNSMSFMGTTLPTFEVSSSDENRDGTFAGTDLTGINIYVRKSVYDGLSTNTTNSNLTDRFGNVIPSFFAAGEGGVIGTATSYDRGIEYFPQSTKAVGVISFDGGSVSGATDCNRTTVIIPETVTASDVSYTHHTFNSDGSLATTSTSTLSSTFNVRTILDYAFDNIQTTDGTTTTSTPLATTTIVVLPHVGYIGYDAFKSSNINEVYFVDNGVTYDASSSAFTDFTAPTIASIAYEQGTTYFPFISGQQIYVRPGLKDSYTTALSESSEIRYTVTSDIPVTFKSRRATRVFPFEVQYGTDAEFTANPTTGVILAFVPTSAILKDADYYVRMTSISDGRIPANFPVALEVNPSAGAAPTLNFHMTDAQSNEAVTTPTDSKSGTEFSANWIGGSLEDLTNQSQTDGDYTRFLLNNGVFVKLQDGGHINHFRSFLRLNTSDLAQAKRIVFTFDEDNAVTDIDNIVVPIETSTTGYYNLNGTKVEKATSKGVYIHNGKKVIVK